MIFVHVPLPRFHIAYNTPVCLLKVVGPEFEAAVMNQQKDKENGGAQPPAPVIPETVVPPKPSASRSCRRGRPPAPATVQLAQMKEVSPRSHEAYLEEGVQNLLAAGQLAGSGNEEPPGLLQDRSGYSEGESIWNDHEGDNDSDNDHHHDHDDDGLGLQPHLEPYYLCTDDGTWRVKGSGSPMTKGTYGTLSSHCSQ